MWQGRPFKPKESGAPLTVPQEVPLATEARAGERAVFDAHVEERITREEVCTFRCCYCIQGSDSTLRVC